MFNLTKTQCQSQPLEYKFKDFIGNIQSLDRFDQRPSFDWTSALTLKLDRFDHDLTSVLKLDRLVWFQNSWVGMARSWLRWCLGDSTSLKRGPKKSLRTSQRKVFSSHCSSHLMSPAPSLPRRLGRHSLNNQESIPIPTSGRHHHYMIKNWSYLGNWFSSARFTNEEDISALIEGTHLEQ